MPGYIRGFVEREFANGWEFVCRLDPFTGSQGSFKYVFFGTGWASSLDPVVHTTGLPDDLAPNTKLAMMGRGPNALDRLSHRDLHDEFRTFRENLSDHPRPRHVSLEELVEFGWERGISDENRAALVEYGPRSPLHRVLRLFELVDASGTEYAELASGEEEDGWRRRLSDCSETEALLRGDWIQFENRTVSLRARSRRDLINDDWFDLLELFPNDYREVRFNFYWHH